MSQQSERVILVFIIKFEHLFKVLDDPVHAFSCEIFGDRVFHQVDTAFRTGSGSGIRRILLQLHEILQIALALRELFRPPVAIVEHLRNDA